jgi:uncharacterized membrane protein
MGIIRPPRGIMLDTPERIKAHAREIAVAAAWSSAMPPSNVTEMSRQERQALASWFASGKAPR